MASAQSVSDESLPSSTGGTGAIWEEATEVVHAAPSPHLAERGEEDALNISNDDEFVMSPLAAAGSANANPAVLPTPAFPLCVLPEATLLCVLPEATQEPLWRERR